MGQHLGTGGGHHRIVAANVVKVLVGVQDLGDVPAFVFGGFQTLVAVQRVDGQGFTGFSAGHKIVEIAVGVGGPNLFDDHATAS